MATAPYSPANLQAYVGIGKQAEKGTGVVPSYFAAFVEQVELNPGDGLREVREGGAGPYVARHLKDLYVPGIRFATPVRPILAGALLAYLLGDDAITGAADPYTHVITPAPATNLWLSLERNVDDDLIERIVDGVLTEVTIDIRKRDQGAEALLRCIGTGLSLDRPATTAESYEAGRPFLRSDCTWTIEGAADTCVESATIVLRWLFDAGISADQVTRCHLVKILFEAEMTLTQLWYTETQKNAYVAAHYGTSAGTAASATVAGDAADAFAVSMDYAEAEKARQFQVALNAVDWDPAQTRITEPDPAASQAGRITRRGVVVKPASGAAVTVTVKNSLATAYDA